MKKRLTALLIYSLFWLFFFIFARALFLLFQFRELAPFNHSTIFGTFIHGLKLDLATVAYIILIPLFLTILEIFFPGKWYRRSVKGYTYALIIIFSGIVLGDANIYSYWGFRLEFSVLGYLKKPIDAMASASTLQMILLFLGFISIAILFMWIFKMLVERFLEPVTKPEKPLVASLALFFLTISMAIPIRGGLGSEPLTASSVYFSQSLFPNHAAINIIWNFANTALNSKPSQNPYLFKNPGEARTDLNNLLTDKGSAVKIIGLSRPNILLIILESFGSSLIEKQSQDSLVTPRFREYISQGVYFSNIYAAGSRTDKAVPALMSGYPNLPLIQVIRESDKIRTMPGIFRLLDSAGYNNVFWYGGDIDFASLNSYLTLAGFRRKVTGKDFRPEECTSKWGAHDEILLNRLQDSLPCMKQPFACAVLTLSSHEPFEVPMEPVFRGKDMLSKFKNSIYYTDLSVGRFIDKARTTDWWKNTLVILIADHGRRNTEKVPVYSEEIFKVPMLWLGGALSTKNMVVSKIGNQFDLPLTLANQLHLKSNFTFSKDLLSPGSASFGFYTYNEGFAFITDTATAIYDIKMKKNILEVGSDPGYAEKIGKSFLQVLFDDYLMR